MMGRPQARPTVIARSAYHTVVWKTVHPNCSGSSAQVGSAFLPGLKLGSNNEIRYMFTQGSGKPSKVSG